MSDKGYRTLMLEPQWHPIRRIKNQWDHDPAAFWVIGFLWDVFVPLVVSVFQPKDLALWPWWRMTLLALGFAPIALVLSICVIAILVCAISGLANSLKWFHNNPPFKVKTRYRK